MLLHTSRNIFKSQHCNDEPMFIPIRVFYPRPLVREPRGGGWWLYSYTKVVYITCICAANCLKIGGFGSGLATKNRALGAAPHWKNREFWSCSDKINKETYIFEDIGDFWSRLVWQITSCWKNWVLFNLICFEKCGHLEWPRPKRAIFCYLARAKYSSNCLCFRDFNFIVPF